MKMTPSSSKQFQADRIDEQAAAVEATAPAELLQGSSSRASASILAPSIPKLSSSSISGSAEHTTIKLLFNTAMTTGAGSIYVTDGFAQTVIDRSTGLPTMRIVGDTHTREIALSSLHFSGNEVVIDADGLKAGHGYSVFMTAGALASVTHQAFAGIRTADRAHFNAPPASTTDTTAPTLVGITFDSDMLKVGRDIDVKFKFSEKVAMPDLAAFTTPHAELGGFHIGNDELVRFTTTDGGITWNARLRANDPGKDVAANQLTVDMTKIFDLAGNAGAGSQSSASYAVDTIVGSAVGPEIVLLTDTGPYDNDYITKGTAQLVEGTIKGAIGAGQHFELRINGIVATTGINLTEFPGGFTWSYDGAIPDGTNTITARVVNDAGHSSAEVTQVIVIDNVAPVISSAPDEETLFDQTSPIVITFNEKMVWQGAEGTEDLLVIEDAEGNEIRIDISSENLSADGKTLTIPAVQHELATGTHYTIFLPDTLTDVAGNRLAGDDPIHLHTSGAYVDVTPPRAVSAKVIDPVGSYRAGAEIEIRVAFNEAVTLLGGAAPALKLNNGATAAFMGLNDANEMVFKYTVGAGQDIGELDLHGDATLLGSVADLAGNALDAAHIGLMLGNAHPETFGSDIAIDTTAPNAVTGVALEAGSDTGTGGDRITADRNPTIKGGGAEVYTSIELYNGDILIGTGDSDNIGNWHVTPGADLADGVYTLTVKQVDAAGNRSPVSAGVTVTIDTTAPAALAAPVLAAASDTGLSHSDGVTADNMPTFSGTGAEPNAIINLYDGTLQVGTTTADGSGVWSITSNALTTQGTHWITAKQVDPAGNESAESAKFKLELDGSAAAVASITSSVASGGTFKLAFTDLMKIDGSIGGVTIYNGGLLNLLFSSILPSAANWKVQEDSAHQYTVLELPDLANGTYRLHFDFSSPVNLVGIASPNLLSDITFTVGPTPS